MAARREGIVRWKIPAQGTGGTTSELPGMTGTGPPVTAVTSDGLYIFRQGICFDTGRRARTIERLRSVRKKCRKQGGTVERFASPLNISQG